MYISFWRKSEKYTTCLLLIFTLFTSSISYCQETLKVRVTNWPPIYFKNENGVWDGMDVELVRAIFKVAKLKAKFVDQPWMRGLGNLKYGKTHLVLNMAKTAERSVYTNWLGPIRMSGNMSIIVKKGNETLPIKTVNDLVKISKKYKKKFGYQRGAFYSNEFNERIKNSSEFGKHFEIISKIELNIKKTLGNRILGFFESPLDMGYRIKNDFKYKKLVIHPFRFRSNEERIRVHYGISKVGVTKETFEKIRSALEKCRTDGTIKKIIEKWNRVY